MKKSIKNIIMSCILVVALVSCNQGPSLQTYFVDNQEVNNFTTIDLPTSVVSFDESKLTEAQKEAYHSIKRLNFLGYRLKEGNQAEYQQEITKINDILNNEKYHELIRMGNNKDGKLTIKYLGSDTKIEELIVFGNSNNQGFGILRVIGDDMQPDKMIKLINAMRDADVDEDQLKGFADFFKGI